jgi:hypothetical protein
VGGPPPGGDSDYDAPSGRKPRRGLIIVLITVAVLAVAGAGAYIGLSLKKSDPDYAVDRCVVQQGTNATLVDCSVDGAYRIISVVDSDTECQDARQPWLEVTESTGAKTYRCLAPVNPPEQQTEVPTPAEE